MSHAGVWAIVVIAGLASAAGWWMLLDGLKSPFLRVLLPALWLAVMLVPAPLPGYPGSFAPALVVFTFEGLFQAQGSPEVAVRLLVAAVAVTLAVVVAVFIVRRRRGRVAGESAKPAE